MTIIWAEPVEQTWQADLTDKALALKLSRDEDIPWWAVALLELKDRDEIRVRAISNYHRIRFPRMWNILADLVERAETTVMNKSIEEWRDLCYNDTDKDGTGGRYATIIRDAALYAPRAFVQLTDIRDEEDNQVVLKDFHLLMLNAMRNMSRPAMIQCFFGGGKSWNSSTIVPLMDWAEWPTATEGRIYLDEDTIKKWTGRLMQIVESNDSLHKLFPWIRKPNRNDPGYKIWSYDGFAIGGNPIQQRSFEAHTIGSSKTGFRFFRTGIDDVVSDKEAATPSIQDRNLAYIKRVALTTRQILKRPKSKYGTVFPGIYTVGTPYDRNDVNVRLEDEYRLKGYKVLRFPVFIANDASRPRWPERDTPQALAQMKDEMGARAFNMRCLLQVGGREHSLFPEADVDFALKDGRTDANVAQWCEVPPNTRLIVGLDPGSGNKVQHHGARYPAWAVYGLRDMTSWMPQHPSLTDYGPQGPPPQQRDLFHHIVQWGRMEGLGQYGQCEKVIELARVYQCPIAFEDNTLQASYGELINKIAPDVKTICHTTGLNKRDPAQGVDQFEPIILNHRLVIHAAGAPADIVKALRDELINWKGSSEKTSGFTDLLMAIWIARYQFSLHVQQAQPLPRSRRPIPEYAARFSQPWFRGSR
jgi:hypothetical protein